MKTLIAFLAPTYIIVVAVGLVSLGFYAGRLTIPDNATYMTTMPVLPDKTGG